MYSGAFEACFEHSNLFKVNELGLHSRSPSRTRMGKVQVMHRWWNPWEYVDRDPYTPPNIISGAIPDRPSSSTPGASGRNSEKKPLTPLLPSSKPQPPTYPWGQMDGRGIERLKEQGGKRPREYSHSVKSRSEPLVGENERTSTYPHLKGARPGPLRSKIQLRAF